jgi:hypothetical protein
MYIEDVDGRVHGLAYEGTGEHRRPTPFAKKWRGWRRSHVVGDAPKGKVANFFMVYFPSEPASRMWPDARLWEHSALAGNPLFIWPDAAYLGFEYCEEFAICGVCEYDNRVSHLSCRAKGCGASLENAHRQRLGARQRAARAAAKYAREDWVDEGDRMDVRVAHHPAPYNPRVQVREFPACTRFHGLVNGIGRAALRAPRRGSAYEQTAFRHFRR